MKVVICTPTITLPFPAYVSSMTASVAALEAAGIERAGLKFTVSNPYISGARAEMLHEALKADADTIVFIDHDMEWRPVDLVSLIETPGEVVAGNYRFKKPDEEYMAVLARDAEGRVIGQHAGDTKTVVLQAERIPAGFMKITRAGVERFMRAYPHLCYGSPINPAVDLFNHGAHEGVWWGEDYAFSRNWTDCGGQIWVLPDLNLTHHSPDCAYPGNYHQFLMRQPGGALDGQPPAWSIAA